MLGGPLFCRLFFCMDFQKINFFHLSCWLLLLLIVYGDIESNPSPGSDRNSNICGLHANLDSLAVAGSDYVLVCTESKVSERRHP